MEAEKTKGDVGGRGVLGGIQLGNRESLWTVGELERSNGREWGVKVDGLNQWVEAEGQINLIGIF